MLLFELDAATDTEMKPILGDIALMGDAGNVHAGMVRVMFVQTVRWTWQELLNWLDVH